jgi:hypothetical protein
MYCIIIRLLKLDNYLNDKLSNVINLVVDGDPQVVLGVVL